MYEYTSVFRKKGTCTYTVKARYREFKLRSSIEWPILEWRLLPTSWEKVKKNCTILTDEHVEFNRALHGV